MRHFPWFFLLVAVGGFLWVTERNRELAAQVGWMRVELDRGRDEAELVRADLVRAREEGAGLRSRIAELETSLAEALARQKAFADLVEARVEAEERSRRQKRERMARAAAPMPEGVRLCLRALQDCLTADGFFGLRFLRASALEDGELRGVEMVDSDPERLVTTLWLAERMTLVLDRAEGRVSFRFREGSKRVGEVVDEFGEEGVELVFGPVRGRLWEERLPFLVRAEGEYPAETAADRRMSMDPIERADWLERVNALLASAKTPSRLVVGGLSRVEDRCLLDVTIRGYGEGGLLVMDGKVKRLAVEIDKKAGIVQLLLRDGVLRQKGGESTITAEGYRMLLQDVEPSEASETMLGMVVSR
ncbi:MAG: hypothetical protein Fur0037_23780 [Planctomycetota bacterium]